MYSEKTSKRAAKFVTELAGDRLKGLNVSILDSDGEWQDCTDSTVDNEVDTPTDNKSD